MTEKRFTYLTEFSGLGGSALGCKQAGGKGMLAIEYDIEDNSQNAYKHLVLNFPEMAEKGLLLNRDITTVTGDEMLKIMDIEPYTLDLFQTSFPCQAFSTSNTARNVDDVKNRLFYTSLEHIQKIKPAVVVGENVSGLSMGVMRQALIAMKEALEGSGYLVNVYKLNASDFGAPQTRPRVWILGVREDIGIMPTAPDMYGTIVGVSDVLPHLDGHQRGQFDRDIIPGNLPLSTLTKTPGMKVFENGIARKPTVEELRVLSTFPADFKFTGTPNQIHERLGNCVLPLQMRILAEHLYDTVICVHHVRQAALKAAENEAIDSQAA